jgi:hypothetical protein
LLLSLEMCNCGMFFCWNFFGKHKFCHFGILIIFPQRISVFYLYLPFLLEWCIFGGGRWIVFIFDHYFAKEKNLQS